MIVGWILIANLAAVLGGLAAYAQGAQNVLLIMVLCAHVAPLLAVAIALFGAWFGQRSVSMAKGTDNLAVRS